MYGGLISSAQENIDNDGSILWRQTTLIFTETETFTSIPVSSKSSDTCNGIPSKIIFKGTDKAVSLIFDTI